MNKKVVKTLVYRIFICSLIGLATPLLIQAQGLTGSLQLPMMTNETTEVLETQGCSQVDPNNREDVQRVQQANWQFVLPANHQVTTLLACPPNIIAAISLKGRVAGISTANAASTEVTDLHALEWKKWITSMESGALNVLTGDNWFVKSVTGAFRWGFNLILIMIILLGQVMHVLASQAFVAAVSLSSFITNSAVQKIWPITLGLANLGFMLALVTIALLTVLRLDVGGGVRRLLPKLFIGALLVNFSLVIGGLIMDITRIVMVLTPVAFGAGSLSALPAKVVLTFDNAAQMPRLLEVWGPYTSFSETIGLMSTAVVWWVTSLAIGVLAVGLLVRYIMLIALLIASPFAYLFVAFPGLSGMSRKWWTTFLKYAFYGPVAIAIVSMGIVVTELNIFADAIGANGDPFYLALAGMMNAALLALFFFVAATTGKYAGILGSAAAVNIAMKTGGRVARAGAKGGYIASGTRKGIRTVREIGDTATRPFRKKFNLGKYGKYDKDGNVKPGKKTIGTVIGGGIARGVGKIPGAGKAGLGDKGAADSVKGVKRAGVNIGKGGYDLKTDKNISGRNVGNLSRGEAAQFANVKLIKELGDSRKSDSSQRAAFTGALASTDSLSSDQIDEVAKTGNHDWIRSVVNNVNVMSNSSDKDKSRLLQAASIDPGLMRDVIRAIARARQAQDRGK